jgi:hypothetical protein
MGLGPPVPIVVDDTQVHKRNHTFYRQFPRSPAQLEAYHCSFCYDEVVWSRIAARHGREFVRHVIPAVAKPARTLWNDFIAFLFCCFGVIFGFKTVRLAMDYAKASPADAMGDLVRLCMAGFCTLVMLWFGLSSFLRARKISRS